MDETKLNNLMKGAEKGLRMAQFKLGEFYIHGNSVFIDFRKGAFWLGEAVKQGHELAFNLLSQKAEEGISECQSRLGFLYFYGEGVETDRERGFQLLERAYRKKDPEAEYFFGGLFMIGLGSVIPRDLQKGLGLMKKAASRGIPDANAKLGYIYFSGEYGIEKDYLEAIYWYEQAAKLNHLSGYYNLGLIYQDGLGVEKDIQKAVFWHEKAAKQGYPESLYELGQLYLHRIPGKEKEGADLIIKAADKGFEPAVALLNKVIEFGKLIQ